MRAARIFVVAASFVASACTTVPHVRVTPSQWRELSSEHFVVDTDLGSDEAKQTVTKLEQLRAALLQVLGPGIDVPVRFKAVVFADNFALRDFGDEEHNGFAVHFDEQPLLVITTPSVFDEIGWGAQPYGVHAHELAHDLSAFLMPHQPRWVAEGLASYLQTIELSRDGRMATIGEEPPLFSRFFESVGPARLSELWDWRVPAELKNRASADVLYPSTWAWLRWILVRYPDRFSEFERRVHDGEAPRAAFAAAFPDDVLRGSRIDVAKSLAWKPALRQLPVPEAHVSIVEHPMIAAYVHAMIAMLWMDGPWKISRDLRRRAVLAELRSALEAEPGNLSATRMLIGISPPDKKLALAKSLTVSHPEAPAAWLIRMSLLDQNGPSPAGTEALEHALAAHPDDGWALNMAAWALLRRHRLTEAEGLAARAVRDAPWSPELMDTYAAILMDEGRCSAAADLEHRAMDSSGETLARNRGYYAVRAQLASTACVEGTPLAPDVEARAMAVLEGQTRARRAADACTAAARKRGERGEGLLTLQIDTSGAVTGVFRKRWSFSEEFAHCVEGELEKLQFGPQPKPMHVDVDARVTDE